MKKYNLTCVRGKEGRTTIFENLFTYDLGENIFEIVKDNSVIDHAKKVNNRIFISTNNLDVYVVVGIEWE